jgi:DDE superfamily endonuclease
MGLVCAYVSLTLAARMFIEIVFERKEAHHGLVSRAIDRGAATRRQRGTDFSSQPAHSGTDTRAFCCCTTGIRDRKLPKLSASVGPLSSDTWPHFEKGGLDGLRQWNVNRPESEMAAYRELIRESFKALATQLGITLLLLPSYSPNLNLIERLWMFIKRRALYGRDHPTFADV